MKKVALVTILDNTNYGTYLQALATGLSVRKLGCDITIIRYIRKVTTPRFQLSEIKAQSFLRYLYHKFFRMPQKERLKKKDVEFVRQFIDVTPDYYSIDDIKEKLPVYDIYMTGSDQVWNSIYNRGIDRCMFLDFAPREKKRVAYAASIGMDAIPESEKTETVNLLNQYSKITVREQQAVDLLSKHGIDADVVLDPTLLLNRNEWLEIAKRNNMDFKEPYMLVYSVEGKKESELIKKYATTIAKSRGLKIYEITYNHSMKSMKFADKHFCLATPEVFLNLMAKASFVVVSSFHGTAFAINMNKQFLTISPGRFNSRVENILNITGLQSRLVKDDNYDISLMDEIFYLPVNEKLETERHKSISALKNLLQ